jgi:hypothetical protein
MPPIHELTLSTIPEHASISGRSPRETYYKGFEGPLTGEGQKEARLSERTDSRAWFRV